MEQLFSYRHASPERWLRRTRTTNSFSLFQLHSLGAEEIPSLDHEALLMIEMLAALEACARLMAECTLHMRAVERRLYGVQQARRPSYMLEAATAAARLSKRERQVLELLAFGWNNQQIGVRLGIAPGTVKNHVSSILAKLSVHSRGEAVAKAQLLGLV